MDWQTFFASVTASLFTSSAIAAGVAYILKQSFDKAIELKYEQILEEFRLSVRERSRRTADLFDLQSKAFREILTQIYRIRNATRKLRDKWFREGGSENEIEELIISLRENDEVLRELLYVYRAVLPDEFFRMAHEVNHQTIKFFEEAGPFNKEQALNDLPEIYEEIDVRYSGLIGIVQKHLGVEEEDLRPG
jgi:hypothetical protein